MHDFELSQRDEKDFKRALDPTARTGNWIAHPTGWKTSDHRGGFIWIYLPLYIFAGRAFYDTGDVFWNEQEFRWRSTALEDCLALILQCPLAHSIFLTKPGRTILAKPAPSGYGATLATTTSAIIASIQLLALFVFLDVQVERSGGRHKTGVCHADQCPKDAAKEPITIHLEEVSSLIKA